MSIRAFGSPHRYVQGAGALDRLADLVAPYGRRIFVVADETVRKLLGSRLEAALGDVEGLAFGPFGGECTAEEIDRMAEAAHRARAEVIVGFGGGKAIDTAKGARMAAGEALAVVPTVASTDSPTSRLVILYTPDHILSEVRLMATNPDIVLVDTEIIAAAPPRFFVAGIGDALSKKFEAEQCRATGGQNFYKARPPELALAAADRCYAIIRQDAEAALEAVREKRTSDAVERVIEATILMSGLAFESGGLSIAHSMTRGLSAIPTLGRTLHGEQVAYGLLVQLVLEGRDATFLDDLTAFYGRIGLPRTMAELGIAEGAEEVMKTVACRTVEEAPYIRQFARPIDESKVLAAMAQLESRDGAMRWPG